MYLRIFILLFFFNPIQSKKAKNDDKLDITTFRDPDKFASFLKSHDNNFTLAMEAMDPLIFQENSDDETINELREIQKRLARSEKFISKIENASNPTMAAFYDIIRLLLDIGPMVFNFIQHLIDLLPIDLGLQNMMISVLSFLDQLIQFGESFFDKIDFEKRREAFNDRQISADSVIRLKGKKVQQRLGGGKKLNDEEVKGIIEDEFEKKILD